MTAPKCTALPMRFVKTYLKFILGNLFAASKLASAKRDFGLPSTLEVSNFRPERLEHSRINMMLPNPHYHRALRHETTSRRAVDPSNKAADIMWALESTCYAVSHVP